MNKVLNKIKLSKNPIIISGHEVAFFDAFKAAGKFAENIGAPVYQQTMPHGAHFFQNTQIILVLLIDLKKMSMKYYQTMIY